MLYTRDFVQVWSLARFFSCFHFIEMSHILISSKETKMRNCFQTLSRKQPIREKLELAAIPRTSSPNVISSYPPIMQWEKKQCLLELIWKARGCARVVGIHSLHTECLKKTGPIKSMWHLTLYYCLLLHRAVWRESHCVKKTKDDCLLGVMAIICHPFGGSQSLENIYGSRMWFFIQTFTELFS